MAIFINDLGQTKKGRAQRTLCPADMINGS